VPVYEIKILEEDERHRVETTYGGVTVEVSKEHPWRMPKYLDWPVKDWATWKEYKKRLDPLIIYNVEGRSFISRATGKPFFYCDTPASLETGIRD
jgi:hypothetical protein